MNKGNSHSKVASFQAFVDKFFEAAPNTLKKYTQYIFDYLLVAVGSEDDEDNDNMSSQLAINMEESQAPISAVSKRLQHSMTRKLREKKQGSRHCKRQLKHRPCSTTFGETKPGGCFATFRGSNLHQKQ